MNKITNYNCDGLCCNKFCDRRYTHFIEKTMNGMIVILGFCENHANEYEDGK